jgi:aminopeptidase N
VSLTLVEARDRAEQVRVHSYEIELDVTDRAYAMSRVTVTFDFSRPHHATFLELAGAEAVQIEGASGSYDASSGRVLLRDLAAHNVVTVLARVPYVTDGEGLHTFTDPVDGETYVSAYTSLDVAQRVFACFDQPDLKAPLTLSVVAPREWTVLANAALGGAWESDRGQRWSFVPTKPIPVYLFTMCAGPWVSREWEYAGVPMGWHARASLSQALDRDLEELRTFTEACFDRYRELFDEPFGFDSYDQVMAPGLNWGAMEFPGCVVYRDELLPPQELRLPLRRRRAMIIAHEMAHMWFGDMATMRWWEDAWLIESFADYMGYRMAQEASGVADLLVDFTVQALPESYAADSRRSAHPVAVPTQDVPDVDTTRGNFDALTYAKGGAALRQLVHWLGDEAFLAGSNAYLSAFAWSNASLTDFVECLDSVTERDVRTWVDAWLTTTGFDTLQVTRAESGSRVQRIGTRPHHCSVAIFDEDWSLVQRVQVDLADEPVALPEGAYVVPNAGGETFAALDLDPVTTAALVDGLRLLQDRQVRAVLWVHLTQQVRCGRLDAREAFAMLAEALPAETSTTTVTEMLTWATGAPLHWWTPVDSHLAAEELLASTCTRGMDQSSNPQTWTAFAQTLAQTTRDVGLLQRWVADGFVDGTAGRVRLDRTLRWTCLIRLARLGAVGPAEIEHARLADGDLEAVLGAASALAALDAPAEKERAFVRLLDVDTSNREAKAIVVGLWDPARAVELAPLVARYVDEAPRLATTTPALAATLGQAFPALPLTADQLALFEARLAGDDIPTVLRRRWEDALDDIAAPLA